MKQEISQYQQQTPEQCRENYNLLKTEKIKLQNDIESCEIETFVDKPTTNEPVENDSVENDLTENKPEQNDQTENTNESIENILSPKISKSDIMITSFRHTANGQEIDVCSAIQTNIGYFTSKSCCQADEIGLFDIETDVDIEVEKNSMWLEEHICFISTSENKNFDFPAITSDNKKLCSINAFDELSGKFKELQLELELQNCFGVPCVTDIDLSENETILNGSSVVCQKSSYFGVITKSKSSL